MREILIQADSEPIEIGVLKTAMIAQEKIPVDQGVDMMLKKL